MHERRIALFGGSFNPPHLAHQMACLLVLETEPVDQIWMVPTYRHPFAKPLAPFADRLEMCRRAAAALGSRVEVSDIERELGGSLSRTYDTVVAIRRRHPDVQLRLMVGADILAERDSWHRWDDVVALAPPIVVGRAQATPPLVPAGSRPNGPAAGHPQGPPLVSAGNAGHPKGPGAVEVQLPATSSTDVRALVAAGHAAVPLVCRAVMEYIAERGLYR